MSSEIPPPETPPPSPADPVGELSLRTLTDPRAMRALAHPVRVQLLEALVHAGTLTATQASDLLGESPANCAFHLRTLAKYGYVEEAGGGRGRERPWRRVHVGLNISADQDDPQTAIAARELGRFWLDMLLDRARTVLAHQDSWPAEWRQGLGQTEYIAYLTPQEARQLGEDIHRLHSAYFDRLDHPERRPAGAMPVEVLLLSYPLLHLAGWAAPVPGPAQPLPAQPPPAQPPPAQPPPAQPPTAQPPPAGGTSS